MFSILNIIRFCVKSAVRIVMKHLHGTCYLRAMHMKKIRVQCKKIIQKIDIKIIILKKNVNLSVGLSFNITGISLVVGKRHIIICKCQR